MKPMKALHFHLMNVTFTAAGPTADHLATTILVEVKTRSTS